jgi:molybdate transport system permease protein
VSWRPLALSFEVAFLATAIAAAVGIVLGGCLALRRFRGRDLLDVLVTSPLIIPPTVLGYYVLVALGRRSPIGRLYEALTGSSIVFTRTGAVVAATIGALPFVVKAARAAIEAVDPALARAARTLGASPWRAVATIVIPLAKPGIVGGLMLGFARALGDFGVTLMVAGDIPGETQTASLAIYDAIQANREGEAAGMIAVLSAFAMLVLYVANKLSRGRA